MGPLGLIAGAGSLPRIVCETAGQRGRPVVAVAFQNETAEALARLAQVHRCGLGQADKVIDTFKGAGVKEVCLIGKIDKRAVFENLKFDLRAVKMMGRLLAKDDRSIMEAIIDELEGEGITVVKQTDWLPALIPQKGVLGKHLPDPAQLEEFERSMTLCRDLAGKEIGQTIIVKEGVVLAVEAVEGTDAAIRRGCELGGGKGAVMIKASRPRQDLRYDIPSVGLTTAKLLAECGARALAVEAGGVVVVDLPDVISFCDKNNIVFAAV